MSWSEGVVHLMLVSALTYAAYPWSVHCKYAMKQNERRFFNYFHFRDTYAVMIKVKMPDQGQTQMVFDEKLKFYDFKVATFACITCFNR